MVVAYQPELFDTVKDVNATLLLSQIKYWFKKDKSGKLKVKIYREGKYWLAKTIKDWWQELRLTFSQVRRALRILVDLGLIQIKIFKFAGSPTTHISLNSDLLPETNSFVLNDISYTETKEEKITNIYEDSEKELTLMRNEYKDLSLGDIVKKVMELKGTKPEIPQKVSSKSMMVWFKKYCACIYDDMGKFSNPTLAEYGQMKHLLKKLGGNAPYLIRQIIEHWDEFVSQVAVNKGLSVTPNRPQVGFILLYADIVLNFHPDNLQLAAKQPGQGKEGW